jgi:uncharacterized protein
LKLSWNVTISPGVKEINLMSEADYLRAIAFTLLLLIAGLVITGCGGSADTSSNGYASDYSDQSDTPEPNTAESGGEQTEYGTKETGEDQYEATIAQPTSSTPSAGGETVLEELPQASATATAASAQLSGPEGKPLDEFLYMVVDDVDSKWARLFDAAGRSYSSPDFVIFHDQIDTGTPSCGGDGSVLYNYQGPQYCFETETIYYPFPWALANTGEQLEDYGDFAVASTVAHEFAHHVQQELGMVKHVDVSSIQMELQADCLSGVWANTIYYEGRLEAGDVEEAVYLAGIMGDTPRVPSYDPNAHGTSQQRMDAFWLGYQTGDPSQCVF